MTREIAHQQSFEKALYAIQPNFPPGKLPGQKEFVDKYYDMSQGDGAERGSWNQGDSWDFVSDREQQCAVDGGDGEASVELSEEAEELLEKLCERTESHTDINPKTGADLGGEMPSTRH